MYKLKPACTVCVLAGDSLILQEQQQETNFLAPRQDYHITHCGAHGTPDQDLCRFPQTSLGKRTRYY